MEYRDDLIRIHQCPACGEPLRFDVQVCEHPHLVLHPRGFGRSLCRLCTFRHPLSREVIVRVIPEDTPWPDYHRLIVAELRAVAGKAGLL